MRKNSIPVIVTMFIMLSIIGGCRAKEKEEGLDEPESYSYVKEENTIEKKSFENGQIVVTKEKKPSKNYATEHQKRNYELSEPSVSYPYMVYEESNRIFTLGEDLKDHLETKQLITKVYKIEADGKIQFYKDIDMKKKFKNYKEDWVPASFNWVTKLSGKYYIGGKIYNNRDGNYQDIYVGLEDGGILENITGLTSDYDDIKLIERDIIIDEVTNFVDKLDPVLSNKYSLYYIRIEGDNKKMPNSALLKKYPEIEKYLELNENEVSYIMFPNVNTDVEQIAQWLLPEGVDMYYNLVLYGDYSKDGQNHEIHSMDEFLEWYQEKK
jgi:hypothetical protein